MYLMHYLLSGARFDKTLAGFVGENGKCTLTDKPSGKIVGSSEGINVGKLYEEHN